MKKIIFLALFCLAGLKGIAQTDTIFWFAAPAVYQGHSDRPIFLRFSNPDPINPVSIEISMPAQGGADPIKQTIKLLGGETQSIDLTYLIDQIELNALGGIENKGIKLQSTNSQKFTVYYENLGGGLNAEIMALKGQNAFGYKFFTPFQNWLSSDFFGTPLPPSIDIVATEAGTTTVSIVPTQPVKIGNVSYPAGSTITKTLTQGQTLSIVAAGSSGPQHPSGTMVTADKKIVVDTKDDSVKRKNIDTNQDNYDLIMDQIIPTDVIGKEYILVRGDLRSPTFGFQDVGIIVATEDGTQITINAGDHQKTITLNKGQTDTVQVSSSSAYFESTKNIYVMHLSGYDFELSGPVLPSIICTGSNSVTFVRSTDKIFILNMLFPTGAENDFKIRLKPNAPQPFSLQGLEEIVPGTGGLWSEVHLELMLSDIPVNTAATISNDNYKFHLGFIDADASNTSRYGYFSDFNKYKLAIKPPSQLCKGTAIELHAGPGFENYYWRRDIPAPPKDLANGSGDSIITVDTDGNYYIQATRGLGCSVDTTISIKFNSPVAINFRKDTAICADDFYTLSVKDAPGQKYKWLFKSKSAGSVFYELVPTDTTYTLKPTESGAYAIELTSANGCVSKDTIDITVGHVTDITYSLSTPQPLCSGADTVIGPTNPNFTRYKYNWNHPPKGQLGLSSYVIQNPRTAVLINNSLQDSIVVYPFLVRDTVTGCRRNDTVRVVVQPAPAIALHDTSGCVNNRLSIRATTKLTNGKIGWSPSAYFTNDSTSVSSTNTYTPLTITTPGVYPITATYKSGGGCPGTAKGKITIYGPTISVSDTSICENQAVDLTAVTDSTGGTVTWSPAFKLNQTNGRNVTFTGANAGRYGYKISFNDKHGCPASDSAYVKVVSTLVADAGPLTQGICKNSPSFKLDGSGSTAGATYLWTSVPATTITNPNDISPTVQPTVTTKFYLQVSAGSCSAKDSITININELPTVTARPDTAVCFNQPAKLKATSTVNGQYSWSPASGVSNAASSVATVDSVKATQTYTVTFTDNNGCVATDQLVVNMKALPVITADDQEICSGGTATLKASIPADPNADYTWMPGGSKNASYAVSPTVPTNYTVTVKDLSTNCSNDKIVKVIVNNLATLKVIGKTNICPGEQTTLTAESNLANPVFTWTPGGNSASITVGPFTTPQTYGLKVTGGGCDKDTTIKITINEKPIVTVNPDPVCLGQTLTLTASPADPSYVWSNGKTGSVVTDIPSTAGQKYYSVQASNVNCTSGKGEITVTVNPKPDFTFSTKEIDVCFTETGPYAIVSPIKDPTYSYKWSPDGRIKDSIHVTKSGTYSLTITNTFGCNATDEVKVEERCDVELFVPKAFTPNGDGKNDSLAVFYYFVKDFEILIFNRWGEIVYKANEKTKGLNTNDKGQNVWDGKYKDLDSPIETYPYIIKYNSLLPNDPKNPRIKRGSVTIIR